MNQTQYDDFLNFMVEMTDKADEISMKYFKDQQLLDVSVKDDGSFVTRADQEIERELRTMIDRRYTSHTLLPFRQQITTLSIHQSLHNISSTQQLSPKTYRL